MIVRPVRMISIIFLLLKCSEAQLMQDASATSVIGYRCSGVTVRHKHLCPEPASFGTYTVELKKREGEDEKHRKKSLRCCSGHSYYGLDTKYARQWFTNIWHFYDLRLFAVHRTRTSHREKKESSSVFVHEHNVPSTTTPALQWKCINSQTYEKVRSTTAPPLPHTHRAKSFRRVCLCDLFCVDQNRVNCINWFLASVQLREKKTPFSSCIIRAISDRQRPNQNRILM